MIFLFLILASYLLGSFPTAVWVGKIFHDIDIREHGSHNAGATNTFRVLGKSWGWIVLAIDISKGYIAASIPLFLENFYLGFKDEVLILQLI
ncbi:MAG: glycerol-3-phosphate acyltransferase, partial [Crocinitomicaceae bacterium]|nr:glycerol-3-phosphate acyltransferase [Crocinitomicaceae bacterium]